MSEPTQTELSELKDAIESFKGGVVWQHILRYMQEMYMSSAEDALAETTDIAKVRFAAGIAHAVRMIAAFDDHITLFKKAKESE